MLIAYVWHAKGLSPTIAATVTILGLLPTVGSLAALVVRWVRDPGPDATVRREAAELTTAFAKRLSELLGWDRHRPEDWRLLHPQWSAADIADYFSGKRLAPWRFVTAALVVAADAATWSQDLRTLNTGRLERLWAPARAADRRLHNRATVGTLLLAAASAIVIAAAGTTVAVIVRDNRPAPPVPKASPATWKVSLHGAIDDTPAVADGRVFVASAGHLLYALNARTGSTEWKQDVGAEGPSSPAVADGGVYIGSQANGDIYAFAAATGKPLWVYPTGSHINSSPIVVDDVLYIGADNGCLYAVNVRTGKLVWRPKYLGGEINGRPTVAAGDVYVGSYSGALYAVNVQSGNIDWPPGQTGGEISFSSPVVAGSLVIVGSRDGHVYAFNESGTRQWVFDAHAPVDSSPVVSNRTVYVGSEDKKLYAINVASGDGKRFYSTGGYIDDQPTVSGGLIYFGSDDDTVYAVTANRVKRWSLQTDGQIDSSPVVSNGTVYFGSDDGNLYAVNALTGP